MVVQVHGCKLWGPPACAGSSSSSVTMAWSPPEHDFGAAISAYHVDYSQVAARQRCAPSWHRAYCGAGTTCEASLLLRAAAFCVGNMQDTGLSPASVAVLHSQAQGLVLRMQCF